MRTGERWSSSNTGAVSVELSADGEQAVISDRDGDSCTVDRADFAPLADRLLAAHVAASRR